MQNDQKFDYDAQPPTSFQSIFPIEKEVLHPENGPFGSLCTGEISPIQGGPPTCTPAHEARW